MKVQINTPCNIDVKNILYFSYLAQRYLPVCQKDETWLHKIAKIK